MEDEVPRDPACTMCGDDLSNRVGCDNLDTLGFWLTFPMAAPGGRARSDQWLTTERPKVALDHKLVEAVSMPRIPVVVSRFL